jgi:hypothetical protein
MACYDTSANLFLCLRGDLCEGQGNGPQAQRYYAEDLRRHSQKVAASTYDL